MSLVDQVPQNVVHHGLEGGWRVGEAKEHDRWFEESPVRPKGCLPLISLLDPDIVVTLSNIKFSEVLGVLHFVDELLNQRQWILVLDCPFIEFAIILYRAQRIISLLDEEER